MSGMSTSASTEDARPLDGYHHATMLCRDAVANVRFYRDVLRLRLLKQTVNFDVPQAYHLYYGDALGTPGTLLTFFPYPRMRDGIDGWGGTQHLALSVPSAPALAYWAGELERAGVDVEGPLEHAGHPVLRFRDPDGLRLELVAPEGDLADVPEGAPALYSERYAIGTLDHALLLVSDLNAALFFYRDVFGFDPVEPASADADSSDASAAADQILLTAPTHSDPPQSTMRLLLRQVDREGTPHAQDGVGRVQHLAFAVPDDAQLLAWQARLEHAGIVVTEVRDRQYFHSIYCNDPDGHLMEIATCDIGFTVDEPQEQLGERLQLPPWLEERREDILRRLPILPLPPTASEQGGA